MFSYFMDFSRLIILSAPSGGGKNTLINAVLSRRKDIEHSISTTTRAPRGSELNGEHYYFISNEEFEKMINENKFLEWARVLKNYYGTSYSEIERILSKNHLALLDIDIQGAMQVKTKHPEVTTIFIEPPSIEILSKRLKDRGTETEEQIKERLELAREELKSKEKYDYIVLNDKLNEAIENLEEILSNQINQ